MHMKWQIADCLAAFYRPNFETLLYPYCPTHIERPKEVKKLFLVNLPERAFLTVRCSCLISQMTGVSSSCKSQ
jgi:cleavage and polyadenylation specificity factor subunit 5